MIAAYKKFWKHYSDFSGRSSRSDYWWVILCHCLIVLPFNILLLVNMFSSLAAIVSLAESGASDELIGAQFVTHFLSAGNLLILAILFIYSLAILVPNLALIVRRLRDGGFHWAMIFLGFVPYIGGLILLVLLVLPTKEVATSERSEV